MFGTKSQRLLLSSLKRYTNITTNLGSSIPRIINNSNNALLTQRCFLSFQFAGPRKLNDILNMDKVQDKSGTEIADLWYSYHENKDNVHGIVLSGEDSQKALERAKKSPFFVQPIFRDDGFFMMVSQFQDPSHFLMAYLEDYKMDPNRAQPLLTFSIFDDYATTKDVTLVRCEILNKGIQDHEGLKVVQNMLDAYLKNEEYYEIVQIFNNRPDSFDIDDYISRQNAKWNNSTETASSKIGDNIISGTDIYNETSKNN